RAKPQTRATTSGMLLASAGIPLVVADRVLGPLEQLTPDVAGHRHAHGAPAAGRGLRDRGLSSVWTRSSHAGSSGDRGFGVPYLAKSPFSTLMILVVTTGALGWLWGVGMLAPSLPAARAPSTRDRRRGPRSWTAALAHRSALQRRTFSAGYAGGRLRTGAFRAVLAGVVVA